MPDMDGIQFVEAVRDVRADLPIVFMTGLSSPEMREKVLKFEKVVFLEKPFQLESILSETIPNLLSQK